MSKTQKQTITLDLSGGRNPAQDYEVHYKLYPEVDRWNRDICDVCIEAVMFSGVDVNDMLSDRDIRIIERAIESLLYDEAQEAMTEWKIDRFEYEQSWLLRAQA